MTADRRSRVSATGLPRRAASPGYRGDDRRAEDVTQLTLAALVYTGLTALAWLRPAAGRRALGLLFATTGLAWNGTLTLVSPHQYPALARRAPWGWYRRVGTALTDPAPRAFGAAMTVGETALAAAVLSRGRAARLGLLGAAVFAIGITPLGRFTLANPVLAAGALHLARRPWPTSAFTPHVSGRSASTGPSTWCSTSSRTSATSPGTTRRC